MKKYLLLAGLLLAVGAGVVQANGYIDTSNQKNNAAYTDVSCYGGVSCNVSGSILYIYVDKTKVTVS